MSAPSGATEHSSEKSALNSALMGCLHQFFFFFVILTLKRTSRQEMVEGTIRSGPLTWKRRPPLVFITQQGGLASTDGWVHLIA